MLRQGRAGHVLDGILDGVDELRLEAWGEMLLDGRGGRLLEVLVDVVAALLEDHVPKDVERSLVEGLAPAVLAVVALGHGQLGHEAVGLGVLPRLVRPAGPAVG